MATTRSRPARRFAVRAALVLALIGVTIHAFVVQTIDAELDRQLAVRAGFTADHLLGPALAAGADPDDVAADVVATIPQVTGVTLRDEAAAVVGQAGAPAGDDVSDTVAVPGTDLVAVISQDSVVVDAAASDLTRRMALVLAAGLLVLWLAIVPLGYRLGRELRGQADELRRQAEELREQGVELQRLLDQEQLTVQRLREVDAMRDRFLESISHELRTPLTVVKGSLQMLAVKGDAIPAELRTQLVERAHEKAERLSALVQALLDLNASAEAPQQRHWVDLRRTVTQVQQALPHREVELDLAVDGIVTDRPQLVRALGALLGNVVRHAPGDDPVVVRAVQHGDDVELVVEDRGPGIPADLHEAVFEPFRHGPLQDAHSPGTGIGLALVAAYAAQHDGRAWVTERPGGGTRVHVLLADVVGEPDDDQEVGPEDDEVVRAIVTPVVSDTPAPRRAAPSVPAPAAGSPTSDPTGDATPSAGRSSPPATRRVVRRVVVRRDGD